MESVAVVSGSGKFDGIYRETTGIVQTLQELGYEVNVYQLIDPGHNLRYGILSNQENMKGVYLPFKTIELGFNRLFIYPRKIRNIPANLVILSDLSIVGSLKDLAKMIVRVPDLRPLTPYGDNRFTTMMFKHVMPKLKNAKRILVYTESMKKELIQRGMDSNSVDVVFPLSTLEEDKDRALRHIYSSSLSIHQKKDIRCLYVASDRAYKSIGFYVSLAERFSKINGETGVHFNLVSKLRHSTRRFIQKLGLRNLSVSEHIEDITTAYAQADILLYPSKYEGFGMPMVEAMFMGIPVIASDLPPMNEIVSRWGTLCPIDSLEMWSNALLSYADPSFYERMAYLSLERSQSFTKEKFKHALAKVFTS